MKFELRQQFQIESARFLPNLPGNHPCSRMHGHSFKIILRLIGDQDPKVGWVRDYHEIDQTVKAVIKGVDHRVLNEVPGLENPTSENLCYWLYEKLRKPLPELVQVIVQETPLTECRYPTGVL
jgi:6-pyruvoyltetrahydropterin/6-carboxytetrahydropterin synthase